MSLTSQLDTHEKRMVSALGQQVIVKVTTSKTIDFTSPRGTIAKDEYEQALLAIPSEEETSREGFVREFRCLLPDLPTSIPLTELVLVYGGYSYQVKNFTQSGSGISVILETTRA